MLSHAVMRVVQVFPPFSTFPSLDGKDETDGKVVMLSHAVIRVVQVFPSFVMLGLACVFVRDGLPSVEM
jgi:hypothetical protein